MQTPRLPPKKPQAAVYRTLDHSKLNVIGAAPYMYVQPTMSSKPSGYGPVACLGFAIFAATALILGLSLGIPLANAQSEIKSLKTLDVDANMISASASFASFDQTAPNTCFGLDKHIKLHGGNWGSFQVVTQITARLLINQGYNVTISQANPACDNADYGLTTPILAKHEAIKDALKLIHADDEALGGGCTCDYPHHGCTGQKAYYNSQTDRDYSIAHGFTECAMGDLEEIAPLQFQKGGGATNTRYIHATAEYSVALYNTTETASCLEQNMLDTATGFEDLSSCGALQGLNHSTLEILHGDAPGASPGAVSKVALAVDKVVYMECAPLTPGLLLPTIRGVTGSLAGFNNPERFSPYECHYRRSGGGYDNKRCADEARSSFATFGCTTATAIDGVEEKCTNGTHWPTKYPIFCDDSLTVSPGAPPAMIRLYTPRSFALQKKCNTAVVFKHPYVSHAVNKFQITNADLKHFNELRNAGMSAYTAANRFLAISANMERMVAPIGDVNTTCVGDDTPLDATAIATALAALNNSLP